MRVEEKVVIDKAAEVKVERHLGCSYAELPHHYIKSPNKPPSIAYLGTVYSLNPLVRAAQRDNYACSMDPRPGKWPLDR